MAIEDVLDLSEWTERPAFGRAKIGIIQSDVECSTGKLSYPTAGDAQKAANHLIRKHKGKTHLYKCSECGQWHLTSSKGRKGKMRI